ncbi:MAG: hypothetical protein DRJ45_06150 [Thermoprotei archaeon]|nr:MAG: hypothetical protein DRJ45_06150 [Thermoprotei archaeon]
MTPEDDKIESPSIEEDDFADAEITNICLCEKDREDAKERTIKLIGESLRAFDRFCQGRASARDLIKSDKLVEAALRYLREKYNFTEEEIEELKEEAAHRYYLWFLRFPFVIEREGYRIYFSDADAFRRYLRLELQRQQQQSAPHSHPQKRQKQQRQQQPHHSQNSQTSQTTLSEFEARELIKRARSILEGY